MLFLWHEQHVCSTVESNSMPLNADAAELIRANLEEVQKGNKPRPAVIGNLTEKQLTAINVERARRNRGPIVGEVVFVGRHIYESRIVRDGYRIDDVITQIVGAMDATAVVRPSPKMTVLENPIARDDGYGNKVNDQAVLECTGKYPRAELYSVIPKGDQVKPEHARRMEKGRSVATLA
jgi:hypothetical protein